MTAAERIAEWSLGLELDDVPNDVQDHAKLHVLDTLGCGLAAHGLGVATEGRAAMIEQGGAPESSVIGSCKCLPASAAAFANAILCHAVDFDDSHSDSICKPSTVSFPTALAIAEATRCGGGEALVGTIVANEITTRLGTAASGAFHARGFHPTAICGIFGATAATARLRRLPTHEAANAIGIAGSFAAGILACLDEGTATKPIHAGWAAHGGILAAQLAALGAEGPRSVIEGRHGLYSTFLGTAADEIDVERELDDLGLRWETPRIAYKPYPACHFSHGVLGAAVQAAGGRQLEAGEVDDVVVAIPAAGISLVLEPIEERRAPRSPYDAQFSLPYSVASILARGRLGLDDFTYEAIADPAVLAIAGKVKYETREFSTYPRAFPGSIRIRLRTGETLEAEVEHQAGSPENPLEPPDVRAKFRRNAALALDELALDRLEATISALERVGPEDLAAALSAGAERSGQQRVRSGTAVASAPVVAGRKET
jgi:2-methylcitrate dehydratase PrpD